jgi:mRNA interferase RelE/StbE
VKYQVELRPRAEKDLRNLQRQEQERIVQKLRLAAEICEATSSVSCNFNPAIDCELAITEFFLKWESDKIVVYRILHRREAYR